MAALGGLLLLAAIATLMIPLVFAYRERQAYLGLERMEAVVVTGQLAPQSAAATLMNPYNAEYRPELLVRYAPPEGGEEIETWLEAAPDLPTMDVWEAMQRLEAFKTGQRVILCHDADDPTELRLDPGNRSWRPAALGGVVSIFVAMPGLGLILAAWLLKRLARRVGPTTGTDAQRWSASAGPPSLTRN
jgi:hypothetical protein